MGFLERGSVIAIVAVLGFSVAIADEMPENVLNASALADKFAKGRTMFGLTPSGNIFEVNYKADGVLSGKTHKDGDQGKWWIKGNTLCRHWGPNWSKRDGKEEACFVIALDRKCIHFHKPNGEWYRTWTTVPGLDPADCDQ